MNKRKGTGRKLIWAGISILIAAISIKAISAQSKSFSFVGFWAFVRDADPRFTALAVMGVLGFIIFEGLAVLRIIREFGFRRKPIQGLVFSAADIYFSAITPSASGGQPASAFFMMKRGIPAAASTAALILNLLMYALAILVIGTAAIILRPEVLQHFNGFSRILIFFGFAAQTVLVIIFILLLKKSRFIHSAARKILKTGEKLHIIRAGKYEDRLGEYFEQYRGCARLISGKGRLLAEVFLYNLLQRASIIMVPIFTYLAVGGRIETAADIWATQCFVVLGSNCIPVPGAIGVSDYLMLDGVENLVKTPVSLELFSRGLSFYICVLLCGIITLAAYIVERKRSKN